jgi:hypothetical protein
MKPRRLGNRDRKTLVILGAGATRGAEFVSSVSSAIVPPIDRDFFQILQLSEVGQTSAALDLLAHVWEVYGPDLDVGMETVFSNLQSAQAFHEKFNISRGRILTQPGRLIDNFNEVLPALMGETINDNSCGYHDAIARSLRTDDAVISLNYDCLIDRSLRDHAGSRFDPQKGAYGVPVATGYADWRSKSRGPQPKRTIKLLKLHGSLNWDGPSSPLALRKDPYTPAKPGVIAPPLAQKPVFDPPFKAIWREARKAVQSMRRLIVVGYSMPDTDGLVRSLLTTDLSSSLEQAIIIDPSHATRSKYTSFLSRVAPSAQVIPLTSFAHLPELL